MRPAYLLLAGTVVCISISIANAQLLYAIDMGMPTDGTRELTGHRAFLVRAQSALPFSSVELSIRGSVAQVWFDPTSSGNYTVRTPGFLPEDNTTSSILNFDTHFLPNNNNAVIEYIGEEQPHFPPPQPNAIPSNPSTWFFSSAPEYDPFNMVEEVDFIKYTVPANSQTTSLDLAYVVMNSSAIVEGEFHHPDTTVFVVDVIQLIVPEPTLFTAIGLASLFVIRRSR